MSHSHAHDHQASSGSCCENDHCHGGEEFNLKRELPILGVVCALFIGGLTFQETLHNSFFGIGEYAIFLTAYLLSGWTVLTSAGRNLLKGQAFDENFLMTIATLGAIAIHELPEAVGVMLFFKIGETFQGMAVDNSRKSIKSLLAVRPNSANLQTEEGIQTVAPETVQVGEIIIVRLGEKVPLDGVILDGESLVDTAALTGESVPRRVQPGETVLAGMINQSALLTVKVTKPFAESSIARILDLVENASQKKAATQKFITTFAQRYTPIVVFLSLAVALLPPFFIPGASRADWIYRALVLLVISCPCGLVISIPLGYFGGIGGAAKQGILIKGSTFLDVLASLKAIALDKTGTLTKGEFKVIETVALGIFSRQKLLELAATAESHSNHPIAQSIKTAYGQPINERAIADYQEFAGQGIQARVQGDSVLLGSATWLTQKGIPPSLTPNTLLARTIIHIAVNHTYAGYLAIADEIKDHAPEAIDELKKLGINPIMMLTGDTETVAQQVSQQLHLDQYAAELLPEDKVTAIETLLQTVKPQEKVAFVGDGINDAPVLARADVGIAMGGLGSDAAIETADVVLMSDDLTKIAQAIQLAKRTKRIVWQNIGLAMGIKGGFILLGIFGIASMWAAVFADVGVALLAILNATRILKSS